MAGYTIALNFEDGVTRFITCNAGEKVLDAAFRNRINLPMDCSDGVCGTCKCKVESGRYDLGDDYIDDALTAAEAAQGLALTCQMIPESDCVVAVPTTAALCKSGLQSFAGTVAALDRYGDAAVVLEIDLDEGQAPAFLPGQYVNIDIPGSGASRSYSFSSAPGRSRLGFLIKRIPGGAMGRWLERAQIGDRLAMQGPMGSFYLRALARPLLMLAGGTGLAPFLSMLEVLAAQGTQQKIRMVYSVTRDADLVLVDQLSALAAKLADFSFVTVVADATSTHPRKGWATQHMPEDLGADFDVYLCGPPPMVDAVSRHFTETGLTPTSFHYEKFTPNVVLKETA